jgi:hypothetical protein
MEGSKYKIGDLVSCYYKTIPPTPQWDPFVEGRPAIVLEVNKAKNSQSKSSRYYYKVFVTTFDGSHVTRTVTQENLLSYEDLPDMDQELEQLVMDYYKKNPLATD